jgi:cytochrome b subunit of formate dehydrogenase
MATAFYHLLYILFSRQGHEEFMQMLLTPQDFKDYAATVLYDLGVRAHKPQFARYSYREKFQYWAFAFFVIVMIISGLYSVVSRLVLWDSAQVGFRCRHRGAQRHRHPSSHRADALAPVSRAPLPRALPH